MNNFQLQLEETGYTFPFVFVKGTGDGYYRFGLENDPLAISIKDFYISVYPVTQILWRQIMGNNPSNKDNNYKPVETVSYNDIVTDQGFLWMLNTNKFREQVSRQLGHTPTGQFRLPTETEWEYAARGGIHWGDYFIFSGTDNIDKAGWYLHNSMNETEVVGQKIPNQLGIYDMCGNVWEWCVDFFQADTKKIPKDGSPCLEKSNAHVLRGGCFHNYGIHCTVMKRYEIDPEYKDPCIGFRLVLPAY